MRINVYTYSIHTCGDIIYAYGGSKKVILEQKILLFSIVFSMSTIYIYVYVYIQNL